MASQEVNEVKRAVMSTNVLTARGRGWTYAQLAKLTGVTPATVRRWEHGESMGTNDQRAELAALKTPKEERPRLLALAATYRHNALKETQREASCAAAGALYVAANHRKRAADYCAYADFLETLGL